MIKGFYRGKNWELLMAGINAVERRGASETGMILIDGAPGVGKTEAIDKMDKGFKSIYVRVPSLIDKKGLMVMLMEAATGTKPKGSALSIQLALKDFLLSNPGLNLILDECQFLLKKHDASLLESVRDLTDATKCICLLIAGEADVKDRLARHAQIASRINRVIEFKAVQPDEMPALLKAKCEVEVSSDLAAEFHAQSGGNMRAIVKGIPILESFARTNDKKRLSLADILADGVPFRICPDWAESTRGARRKS